MQLFTSELFNGAMARQLQPRAPRSYRAAVFARRYGRRAASTEAAAIVRPSALEAYAIECIGDRWVLLDCDQAA